MGKKRSKSQRIGTEGEVQFRQFASRHRLIANKCDEDFGTDFICQIEGVQDKTGTAQVLGGLIGAFVRATESNRGRIHLDKNDADHLLACEYPICVILVHLRPGGTSVHFGFVDGRFGEMLATFLDSGEKHRYLVPSDLIDESLFDQELRRALAHGFVEQFRVQLAKIKLDRVIPHSKIQVRRSENGSFTLVRIKDFFSQFKPDALFHPSLDMAMFGQEHLMTKRLSDLPIRRELIESLKGLPSPLVVETSMSIFNETIEVKKKDGSVAGCLFEFRKSPDRKGWVHRSGFAITISESTLHEDKWVHLLQSQVDPEVHIVLADYEDLWGFLENCEPEATLQFGDSTNRFDIEWFRDLLKYGFFARYLRGVYDIYDWPKNTWHLSDATDDENLNTLAFLFYLNKVPEHFLNNMGFTFSDLESCEAPVKMWVPICMNLPRAGLVVWVLTKGKMLSVEGKVAGFRFGRILDREMEIRSERFTKSPFPEIVAESGIKTIPLVPPTEDLNQHSSDASTWGVSGFCGTD